MAGKASTRLVKTLATALAAAIDVLLAFTGRHAYDLILGLMPSQMPHMGRFMWMALSSILVGAIFMMTLLIPYAMTLFAGMRPSGEASEEVVFQTFKLGSVFAVFAVVDLAAVIASGLAGISADYFSACWRMINPLIWAGSYLIALVAPEPRPDGRDMLIPRY